jgi:hypothetical protein
MDANGWTEVGAIGTIGAILAGFVYPFMQNWLTNCQRERDRAHRAEGVAFQLSGWLGEVGSRVSERSQFYQRFKNARDHTDEDHPLNIRAPLKLHARKLDEDCGIENVISDLHYLRSGSGDITQLAFHARSFDEYLDSKEDEAELLVDKSIEGRLRTLRELHASAEHHLNAAMKRERRAPRRALLML